MTLVHALASLTAMEVPVFETADAAAWLDVSNAHASAALRRLAAAGHLVRLRRGLWGFPGRIDPLAIAGRLTAPLPSYVSLQSALFFHGMVSQVPVVIYAVSLARARRFDTPLGTVSIHHVRPSFFFGFGEAGRQGAMIASPEKALVDYLYLSPARSGLFRALPEVEFPRGFSRRTAREMAARVAAPRRRAMVERDLERLLAAAATRLP